MIQLVDLFIHLVSRVTVHTGRCSEVLLGRSALTVMADLTGISTMGVHLAGIGELSITDSQQEKGAE